MNSDVTVAKAAKATGLKPSKVSTLIFRKVIIPEVHRSKGYGDYSVLSDRNLKELRLSAKLQSVGVKQDSIRMVLELLLKSSVDWWSQKGGYVVVLENKKWFVTDNPFTPANLALLKKEPITILIKL